LKRGLVEPRSARVPTTDEDGSWLAVTIDGLPAYDAASPSGPWDDADDRLSPLIRAALTDRRGPRTIVLGLQFVDPIRMAELNAEHMGHDGATDVLSFPIDGDPIAEPVAERPAAEDLPPWLLGDVVICPAVAAANAPGHAGSFDDEIALLLVHGLLHLLGHDHANDDDRRVMQALERDLLAASYGPLSGDPWTP
jgi:probable rRNA maturation factor